MQPSTTLCPTLLPLSTSQRHVGRRIETLLRFPGQLIRLLPHCCSVNHLPRIITSPVISPLFSYARDNGYVANHSCTSIDLARRFFVPFHRLSPSLSRFEPKLSIRFDSIRLAPHSSLEIQISPSRSITRIRYNILSFFRLI